MKFSLMTEPHLGGTYDQQLEAARWCEQEGLYSFARCDHFLSGGDPTPDATDAFAVLAGLARDTANIRLCVLVSPITFRHPRRDRQERGDHRPDVGRPPRPWSWHGVDGVGAREAGPPLSRVA